MGTQPPSAAVLKGMPRPKGAPARPPNGSVQDALDSLESRRRRKSSPAKPKAKPGADLDLDSIP